MRIVSWNCNMAFRKKWQHLISFNPDVLIVQECESPRKFTNYKLIPNLNQFLWFGDNENKGLGIFTFHDVNVEKKKENSDFRFVIPLKLKKDNINYHIFSIWAMPDKTKKNSYVGQLWNAFMYYRLSSKSNYMIIGDWNSHVQWDNERKQGNHSMLISKLMKKGIISMYHHINGLEQGSEVDPTFYLVKKRTKPYHLDYCALSKTLLTKDSSIKIGQYDHWIKYSDHMPLFISLSS